jgi:hypothetical protein
MTDLRSISNFGWFAAMVFAGPSLRYSHIQTGATVPLLNNGKNNRRQAKEVLDANHAVTGFAASIPKL